MLQNFQPEYFWLSFGFEIRSGDLVILDQSFLIYSNQQAFKLSPNYNWI